MNARRRWWALGSLLLALGGCGQASGSPPTSAGGTVQAAPPSAVDAAPSIRRSSAGPVASAATFSNPVIAADFPDPFILRTDGAWLAYGTTDGTSHLQLARSVDLIHWTTLADPLPRLPDWSTGDTWAPEVLSRPSAYVLYYSARDPALLRPDGEGSQCVSAATGQQAEGPFIDASANPLVCQPQFGGSIDATAFVDVDGSAYLIWKNDGNCCGLVTRFFLQRLSGDGLSLVGQPMSLGLVNDAVWEGALIEAPTLIAHDGTYYLFFSANDYDTDRYAVGYATSKTVSGPYVDAPENPILASGWERPLTSRARGPGHTSVFEAEDGRLWIAFHAWDEDAVGYENSGRRSVWIEPLTLTGGIAKVDGPTDRLPSIP